MPKIPRNISMSFIAQQHLRLRLRLRFVALLVVPLFLSGCLLGSQPQLLSIKAGEVAQVKLRCNNSSNLSEQDIKEKLFWVMITEGEGAIRAKYRVLKKGRQSEVLSQGLTPDTVSLTPSNKYVVEITHPESGTIHTTEIGRTSMPLVGFVIKPDRALAAFSADQQPLYKDVLQGQYTYKRGGKVILPGSVVEQCNF